MNEWVRKGTKNIVTPKSLLFVCISFHTSK